MEAGLGSDSWSSLQSNMPWPRWPGTLKLCRPRPPGFEVGQPTSRLDSILLEESMFESKFRAHSAQFQKAYDRMPYPLQNVLTSARGWFLTRNRYARDMHELLKELRSHENWDADEIKSYQTQALQKILDHARASVPFYSKYPAVKLNAPEDIASC